jgi:hypothetical protein
MGRFDGQILGAWHLAPFRASHELSLLPRGSYFALLQHYPAALGRGSPTSGLACGVYLVASLVLDVEWLEDRNSLATL